MSIINNMPNSGMKINGLIEEYYVAAGETVNAGDFVKFVNGVASKTYLGASVDTSLYTAVKYPSAQMAALLLDEERVFLVFGSTSNRIQAAVITISGYTISIGTVTIIDSSSWAANPSLLMLPDGRILIIWTHGAYYFYADFCTVVGTTITLTTGFHSTVEYDATHPIRPLLLNDDTIFCGIPYNGTNVSYDYLYCRILKLKSDGGLTAYSNTVINSSRKTATNIQVGKLSDTNALLLHTIYSDSINYLYGMICTVQGSAVTWGEDYKMYSSSISNFTSLIPLVDNTFLLGCNSSFGAICTVINNIPILEIMYTLFPLTAGNARHVGSVCDLFGNHIISTKGIEADPTGSLQASILKNEGKALMWLSEKTLNTNLYTGVYSLAIGINSSKVLVLHSGTTSDSYLYGQLWELDYFTDDIFNNKIYNTVCETQVLPTTVDSVNGIAKSAGTGGDSSVHNDKIEVYVPGVKE